MQAQSKIPVILEQHRSTLLQEWARAQSTPGVRRVGVIQESELRAEIEEFLQLLAEATRDSMEAADVASSKPLRAMLGRMSRTRSERGFTPSETASFVLTLKRPLFAQLRSVYKDDPEMLVEEILAASELLDKLSLFTTELYQQSREEVIHRQQQDMLELSTPVVKLWEGILALPLIGTLDSSRTQVVMETLLQRVVETGSEVVIIDITGVAMVDTLVAQHLMKTVAAARLMGVECIISGIRPQIAQTIVHLAVDLGNIATKATLAEAFRLALRRSGASIARSDREAGRQ